MLFENNSMNQNTQNHARNVELKANEIKTASESIGLHMKEIEENAKKAVESPDNYSESEFILLNTQMDKLKKAIVELHRTIVNVQPPKAQSSAQK